MPEVAQQNDVYQLRLVGHQDGQETNNVLHFQCASGAGDADVLTHLVLVFAACFIDNLLPVLSESWAMDSIRWKKVSPTLGDEIVSIPVGTAAGGGAHEALPSYASVVFSIKTGLGGRSRRGRMFLAGIPESATINSFLDTTDPFWAALLAFAACMITHFVPGDPVGTNSWALCVYSRKIGGSHLPFGQTGFAQAKSITPSALLATTRSRKVGRGS